MATSNSSPPSEETLVTSNSATPSEETLAIQKLRAELTKSMTRKQANNIYEFIKLIHDEESAKLFRRSDMSPLYYCIMEDDSETVAALIKAGANIHYAFRKKTLLDFAAGYGSVDCVKLLCGLNINMPSLDVLDRYILRAEEEEKQQRILECRGIIFNKLQELADKNATALMGEVESQKKKKTLKTNRKKKC